VVSFDKSLLNGEARRLLERLLVLFIAKQAISSDVVDENLQRT
jgi:hypothetical protein